MASCGNLRIECLPLAISRQAAQMFADFIAAPRMCHGGLRDFETQFAPGKLNQAADHC
jgi:hypothetical protein